MKGWKHLTLEQRKAISNGISHNYKLKEIENKLGQPIINQNNSLAYQYLNEKNSKNH